MPANLCWTLESRSAASSDVAMLLASAVGCFAAAALPKALLMSATLTNEADRSTCGSINTVGKFLLCWTAYKEQHRSRKETQLFRNCPAVHLLCRLGCAVAAGFAQPPPDCQRIIVLFPRSRQVALCIL